ncbi:MAG TPA: Sua5/YciO/YrdC/YwlC family protein [Isosphaeraceae bacterium]
MSEPPATPERIDLTRADDPRDVVHRAVACLAQGGVLALPTETSYGLAAGALHPDAVARLRRVKGPEAPVPLCVKGAEELADWVPDVSALGRRLASRAWPGPVILVCHGAIDRGLVGHLPAAVRAAVAPDGAVGLRCPGHPILREILRLVPGPLVLTGAHAEGQAPPAGPEPLLHRPELDMILDDGPAAGGGCATAVRVDAEGWRVVRPGVVGADDLTRMSGTILLFVCTGNTCRSPMAEALCKTLLAERLGCAPDELEGRGFVVLSAGLSAMSGAPAAAHAAEIVHARGGSLQHHASRRITHELVRHADLIVAMTRDHLDALLYHVPEAADRVRLLHAAGEDIDDPIGADRDTYLHTAREIEEHLGHLLDELGI